MVDLPITKCPNAYAGCYSLHLYCDRENPQHGFREFPHEIDQFEHGSQARQYARKLGWVIYADRTATCPKCSAILKEKRNVEHIKNR